MTHDLKTWPEQFEAVSSGIKTFEVRDTTDRSFAVGDILRLKEWCQHCGRFTGREVLRRVTLILRGGEFGLPRNLNVMAIAER